MNARAIARKLRRTFKHPEAIKLLRPDWRQANEKSGIVSTGFCYVATEALFYLLGGAGSGWKPMCVSTKNGTHWWLERNGEILDATFDQFINALPPYHLGRGCGFQNGHAHPSRRATAMIDLYKQTQKGVSCGTSGDR